MKRIVIGMVGLMMAGVTSAADFFSTEQAERLLTLNARVGLNTANRTVGNNTIPGCYHYESWRTGFDVGFAASLNFRDYLTIQPGIFFDIYNSGYTFMGRHIDSAITGDEGEAGQAGRLRTYNITIPVMAVINFNVTDDVRWSVEAGPYLSLVLGSSLNNKYIMSNGTTLSPIFMQKPATVDFGVKMGMGIRLMQHYYVGVHYLQGCLDGWKEMKIAGLKKDFNGLTKAWTFTVGYEF